jgi:hypothetical protein
MLPTRVAELEEQDSHIRTVGSEPVTADINGDPSLHDWFHEPRDAPAVTLP